MIIPVARNQRTLLGLLMLLLGLAAEAQVPLPAAEHLPVDPGTGPADRNLPFLAWHEDLSADGYVEQEVQVSGEANTYVYRNERLKLPRVNVATSGNEYTTRLLLRHPADPEDFNGIVYFEILNATANYDGAPMWNLTYPSIIADGAAWVGITYAESTARFLRDVWGTENFPAPPGAEPRDRSRYANINIASRAYTWDMISQAAALLKADSNESNPMAGFDVRTIILTGYSQSARYVTTYSNSFFPLYGDNPQWPLINGFIVAAGGPVASLLNGERAHPPEDPRNFAVARAKTMVFVTESDIDAVAVRQTQAERRKLRWYEIAGGSHVDLSGTLVGRQVAEFQFGVAGEGFGCDLPLNPIRTGVPLAALQKRLAQWLNFDRPPPDSRFIDYDPVTDQWVRDADGNVTGGVRPARIDVPLGTYTGDNPYSGPSPSLDEIFCALIIGGYDQFTAAELEQRYGTRQQLALETWWALFQQWLDGFILPVDAAPIINEALGFEGLPE